MEIKAGMKFERWTVVNEVERQKRRDRKYLCICECGNYREVTKGNLIRGKSKSCGCLRVEMIKENGYLEKATAKVTKHSSSHSRLYNTWHDMKARCNYKKCSEYKNYGLRGIKVCEEWEKSFSNFQEWAMKNGYKEDLQIDRINVNGNYEPNNCRWVSPLLNSNNKRNCLYVIYKGEKITLTQLSRNVNIPFSTLKYHYKKGKLEEYIIKRNGVL